MGNVEELQVSVDDTYMRVIAFGEGEKNLVMVPGMSLTGLAGQGEVLEKVYDIFTKDYRVYLIEQKKVLKKGVSVEDMADDLKKAFTELHISKASIYGASLGGMIAQPFAFKYPDMVEKMVLCSTYPGVTKEMMESGNEWIDFCNKEDVIGLNRSIFKRVYSSQYLKAFESLLPQLEKQGSPEDCVRYAIMSQACLDFDFIDKTKSISCPCLVIGSKGDETLGYSGTIDLAEALDCDSYLYEGYGHAVYDEAPDITERVYNWLKD